MAASGYGGISNVAQKFKAGYCGIGNVARKIKKGYCGIGNVARLCFSTSYEIERVEYPTFAKCTIYWPISGAVGNSLIFHSQEDEYERGTDARDSDHDYGYTVVTYNATTFTKNKYDSFLGRMGCATAKATTRLFYAGGRNQDNDTWEYTYADNRVYWTDQNGTYGSGIATLPQDKAYGCGVSMNGIACFTGGEYYERNDADDDWSITRPSTRGAVYANNLARTEISTDTSLLNSGFGFPNMALYCAAGTGSSAYARVSKMTPNSYTVTSKDGIMIPKNAFGVAGVGSVLLVGYGHTTQGYSFYTLDGNLSERRLGPGPEGVYCQGGWCYGAVGSNGNTLLWITRSTDVLAGTPSQTWYMDTNLTFIEGPLTSYASYRNSRASNSSDRGIPTLGDTFFAYLGWADTSSTDVERPSAGYGMIDAFRIKYN